MSDTETPINQKTPVAVRRSRDIVKLSLRNNNYYPEVPVCEERGIVLHNMSDREEYKDVGHDVDQGLVLRHLRTRSGA